MLFDVSIFINFDKVTKMYAGYENPRQPNPRHLSNILSFLTFGYTIPLFKKGYNGNLQELDIYEVPKTCNSKRCGDKISKDWENSKTTLKLLVKTFGRNFFLYTTIHLTWNLIHSTVHPYAMSNLISYFERNQTRLTKLDAYYYGGLVISMTTIRSLWIHNYFMLELTLGLQIRSSLTSLIYRKVLKLPPGHVKESSMGGIITILTKDIRIIETTIWPLSDLVIGFIKFVYLTCLLYIRIGVPSLLPTGLIFIGILTQAILSKFVLKLRLKAGKMSDKRLHFTKDILSALKIIKMYTWETFFHSRVCEARKAETNENLKGWYLATTIIVFGTLFAKLLFPIFLLTYISLGYSINTELIYYIMALFRELAVLIGSYFPYGFELSAELYAAVLRVGRILNMQGTNSGNLEKYKRFTEEADLFYESKIHFKKASVTIEGHNIVDSISLTINKSGLYIITGPSGSGKTAILKMILEEYPISRGQLQVLGTISYSSQDPWLFPATVRQNILFGEPFDQEMYDKVLNVCCLKQDFSVLPLGDDTVIIDGGLNLSKGQQARINLARAIYKRSDIYLLDDPLTCLDVKVQNAIFHKGLRNCLKDKIVILISQNCNYFQYADKIVTLKCGRIKSAKEHNELTQSDSLGNVELKSSFDTSENVLNFESKGVNATKIFEENNNVGGIAIDDYHRYIKYGGGFILFSILLLMFFIGQFSESYTEKLLSEWVDYRQNTLNNTSNTSKLINTPAIRDNTFDFYIIMSVITAIIDLAKSYWFLVYCRKASIQFHKSMSRSVINSAMTFLNKHFIGNILNRFSYDLDIIDEVFPFIFKELLGTFFAIAGALVLLITVDWIFLFISFIFFITLVILRMFYIPTARALKRLGASTRSPFIGHLNATVDGLSTIKAFKAEKLLQDEFDKHQDLAVSVAYMEQTAGRAFGFVLDLDCSLFITLVILSFLLINRDTSVGNIGLALTQVMSISTNLNWIVRAWTLLEQCMTSVERVVEYIEIPQENKAGKKISNWPKRGKIDYMDVNLIYNFDSKVLKGINFTIMPGERVGIVGRTGAGKSSIISTLFRLYDYQGNILIDEVDIRTLSIDTVRSRVSIIPQDPITFIGTIRENLDPLGVSLDKDIWKALKNVTLDKLIGSLNDNIFDLSLSTGQKQLLCLARVLLKENHIVVMDEPTANLDTETEYLVYELIDRYLSNCTLIMIAHRLEATLNCNRVMVMENGEIAEFDVPQKLLANKESLFYRMNSVLT